MYCPFCGGRDIEHIDTNVNSRMYECTLCRRIFEILFGGEWI